MDLISVEQQEGRRFKVQVKRHVFESDMSVEDGGKDGAPSPVHLMVGALGACMGMAIDRYCQTIKCPSEGITVSLTYQLAKDPVRVGAVTADIELPKDFPKERRDAVLRVIEACPVHNTLRHAPEIDAEIVDG